MPFLSIEFSLFFMCFFPIYWSLRFSPKAQNLLLLLTSLSWLVYLQWMFAIAVVVFAVFIHLIAFGLSKSSTQHVKKIWLILGIIISLMNLAFFKYYDFFRPFLQSTTYGSVIDILMPLGISYYTFQSISYLVSLYKKEIDRLDWYELALYLSFFPTITSGPILRAGSMKTIYGVQVGASEQIKTKQKRQIIRPALAIALILLGVAKKWWLAGTLGGGWVDPVFENPMQYSALSVLVAIYGYTIQLFLDFSGYTDLVIGIGMLLGFRLPQNFFMPLIAFNIRDFWDRWHISLSTWIRDYIYIPLGGSKKGFVRTQFNLLVAMLLSGIWHGYGWNFFVWGLIHGLALVLLNIGDKIVGGKAKLSSLRLGKILGIFITFNFVCFAFVIFHTTSLNNAWLIFTALFQKGTNLVPNLSDVVVLATIFIWLVFYNILVRLFNNVILFLEKLPIIMWVIPVLLILVLVVVLAPSGIPGFIYANF